MIEGLKKLAQELYDWEGRYGGHKQRTWQFLDDKERAPYLEKALFIRDEFCQLFEPRIYLKEVEGMEGKLCVVEQKADGTEWIRGYFSSEPKPEYNQEVCQHSGLDPASHYAEPLCKIGHGWSSDCDRGVGKKCPDFIPARIPTLAELKKMFGKPKPDESRLLVNDIHNPFSHLPRLKNPLSAGYIDVGEVYAEGCHDQFEEDTKTASIKDAECQEIYETLREIAVLLANPLTTRQEKTKTMRLMRAVDEAWQLARQALKKQEGVK